MMLDTQMPTQIFEYPKPPPSPEELFYAACARFEAELAKIDRQTPWQRTEPVWWLQMQAIGDMARAVGRQKNEARTAGV